MRRVFITIVSLAASTCIIGCGSSETQQPEESQSMQTTSESPKGEDSPPGNELFELLNSGALNSNEAAEAELKKLSEKIAKNDKDLKAYRKRGLLYKLQGQTTSTELDGTEDDKKTDFEKAIDDFSRALELSPDNAQLYRWRAQAYNFSKQPEKAIADAEKLSALDPEDTESYEIRANAYSLQGKHTEAIKEIDKTVKFYEQIEDADGLASALRKRADINRAAGQFDKSIDDLKKVLEMVESKSVMDRLMGLTCHYSLASVYLQKKDYEEAIEEGNAAIKAADKGPVMASIYTLIAEAESKLGRHEKAVEVLEQAIKKHPDYVDALKMCADEQDALGNKEKATELRKKAESLSKKAKPTDDKDSDKTSEAG